MKRNAINFALFYAGWFVCVTTANWVAPVAVAAIALVLLRQLLLPAPNLLLLEPDHVLLEHLPLPPLLDEPRSLLLNHR